MPSLHTVLRCVASLRELLILLFEKSFWADFCSPLETRQSPYPKSNQRRHHVPDSLIDWKVCKVARDKYNNQFPEMFTLNLRKNNILTWDVTDPGSPSRSFQGAWQQNE